MREPRRIEPGPGQESVWDYPRPPRLEQVNEPVRVIFNGVVIAETSQALRILETSHPPTYYVPPGDVRSGTLVPNDQRSFCEWKGQAHYFDVVVNQQRAANAAWSYPEPVPAYSDLRHHVAFYAQFMEACYVGDELVHSQAGSFYGGWITNKVVGPFKGEAGTWGW
jgi:uncharacterized protein (DUF427 family)